MKQENEFFNKAVKHFHIVYSDNSVYIDQMPFDGTVRFKVLLTLKDGVQKDAIKHNLKKYGAVAYDDMLDGDVAVSFGGNHDDAFMDVMADVLQYRQNAANVGVFNRGKQNIQKYLKKFNLMFSRNTDKMKD